MRKVLLAAALAALVPSVASSQTPAPTPPAFELGRDHVDKMFSEGHANAAWFTKSFLERVSVAEIDGAIARVAGQLGGYDHVEGVHGDYIAHFSRGTDEVFVGLDENDKINYLVFRTAQVAGPQ